MSSSKSARLGRVVRRRCDVLLIRKRSSYLREFLFIEADPISRAMIVLFTQAHYCTSAFHHLHIAKQPQ